MPGVETFRGISRSAALRPIRGLRWDSFQYDETLGADLARLYNDRVDALRYAFSYIGIPISKPKSDTWHIFLNNWAQVGLQHERRTYCQLLLSA